MARAKKIWISVGLAAFCMLGVFIFILYLNRDEQVVGQEEVVGHITAMIPAMTSEERIAAAELILRGEIITEKEIKIRPVADEGAVSFATDYTVAVRDILRGAEEAQTVTVRILGNPADGIEYVNELLPDLTVGGTYLFLLYRPGMGGSYNTEGDYYYIVNCDTGVYEEENGSYIQVLGDVDTYDTQTQTMEGKQQEVIADYQVYKREVEKINAEEPVQSGHLKEDSLEALRSNLERGWISQQEYDNAVKNSQSYATIVE